MISVRILGKPPPNKTFAAVVYAPSIDPEILCTSFVRSCSLRFPVCGAALQRGGARPHLV